MAEHPQESFRAQPDSADAYHPRIRSGRLAVMQANRAALVEASERAIEHREAVLRQLERILPSEVDFYIFRRDYYIGDAADGTA